MPSIMCDVLPLPMPSASSTKTDLHHRRARRGSIDAMVAAPKYGKLLHTHGRVHQVIPEDSELASMPVVSLRPMQRTTSCGVDHHSMQPLRARYTQKQLSESSDANRPRYKLTYQDEAVRARCAENTRRLVETACAATSPASATNVLLAKKALRFRKALHRVEQLDEQQLQDPTFDVLEKCMGVTWAKVEATTLTV